jgi:hypothetical protein
MKNFELVIDYIEVDITANTATHGELPFHTRANSFEEARSQALEHAQAIARGYKGNKTVAFFFRICTL